MTKSIIEKIKHYQQKIYKSYGNEAGLLHCIEELNKLPIKIHHLQETGVGSTINSLQVLNEVIAVAAEHLLTKWNAILMAEMTVIGITSQTNENDENDGGATSQHPNHRRHSTSLHGKDKAKHKECSSTIGHKKNRHSASSHKLGEKSLKDSYVKHESSSNDKENHYKIRNRTTQHKTRSSSSTKSNRDNKHGSSLMDKNDKTSPQEGADKKESKYLFDSSMGINFNDVLGILDGPIKKTKISLNAPSSNNKSEHKFSAESLKRKRVPNSDNDLKDFESPQPKLAKVSLDSSPLSCSSRRENKPQASPFSPDLLKHLDPSMALQLLTNYSLTQLNQMDCDVNADPLSNSRPERTNTEAIAHAFSSTSERTKIYSGISTGKTKPPASVYTLCIRKLQNNIDFLMKYTGASFEVLKPVLEQFSPQQLHNFEKYNPYIMVDTDGLWQVLVQRIYHIKTRDRNEPWREIFMRCKKEEDRNLNLITRNIYASHVTDVASVRKTELVYVDSLPKPPRDVQRKQQQNGTKSKMVATPASRVASLQSVTSNTAAPGTHVHKNKVNKKKAPLMAKALKFANTVIRR